jgi:hypothetical protein
VDEKDQKDAVFVDRKPSQRISHSPLRARDNARFAFPECRQYVQRSGERSRHRDRSQVIRSCRRSSGIVPAENRSREHSFTLTGHEVLRLLAPEHETGNVPIHSRVWIRSQEFDDYPIVTSRSCRERIEHQQLLANLPLLLRSVCRVPLRRNNAGNWRTSSECQRRRGFEGKVYGIGTPGNLSHRSHRSVQHDCIASPDAQLAELVPAPLSSTSRPLSNWFAPA